LARKDTGESVKTPESVTNGALQHRRRLERDEEVRQDAKKKFRTPMAGRDQETENENSSQRCRKRKGKSHPSFIFRQ